MEDLTHRLSQPVYIGGRFGTRDQVRREDAVGQSERPKRRAVIASRLGVFAMDVAT